MRIFIILMKIHNLNINNWESMRFIKKKKKKKIGFPSFEDKILKNISINKICNIIDKELR